MAIPNFSEGRDPAKVRAISEALAAGAGVRLLDVHSDADHHRSVYTLAGAPGALTDALLAGAARACVCIDVMGDAGAMPDTGTRALRGSTRMWAHWMSRRWSTSMRSRAARPARRRS